MGGGLGGRLIIPSAQADKRSGPLARRRTWAMRWAGRVLTDDHAAAHLRGLDPPIRSIRRASIDLKKIVRIIPYNLALVRVLDWCLQPWLVLQQPVRAHKSKAKHYSARHNYDDKICLLSPNAVYFTLKCTTSRVHIHTILSGHDSLRSTIYQHTHKHIVNQTTAPQKSPPPARLPRRPKRPRCLPHSRSQSRR